MNNLKNELLENKFMTIQKKLQSKINLKKMNSTLNINTISGVDLAYWQDNGKNYAVCCIISFNFNTHEIIEKKHLTGEITVPYVAGYLSFRELPLILKTYELLEQETDMIMFDGNGYLHYRHMGIATHASFYLNKPTIGVAKSYLKIEDIHYQMPENKAGAYTDIIINNEIYGRALRTLKDVKPIFVSSGNWIDLDTSTKIVMQFIDKESRIPIPVRYADIETRKMRENITKKV